MSDNYKKLLNYFPENTKEGFKTEALPTIWENSDEFVTLMQKASFDMIQLAKAIDTAEDLRAVQKELMSIPEFGSSDETPFAEERKAIHQMKKAIFMVAGAAVQKFGAELEDHQQLLMAAADMLIEIYMAESAVLRTEKMAKKLGADKVSDQLAMTQLYLYNAVDIVTQKGKEGIVSFAEGDEQRMMLMGLRRYTKYVNMPNVVKLREQIAAKVIAENKYCF
mgnify:CR=1 FL=1